MTLLNTGQCYFNKTILILSPALLIVGNRTLQYVQMKVSSCLLYMQKHLNSTGFWCKKISISVSTDVRTV